MDLQSQTNQDSLAERAKDKAAEFGQKAQDLTLRAQENLHDAASRAADKASELGHKAQENLQGLADKAGEKADGALQAAGQKLSDAGATLWEKAPSSGPLAGALSSAAATLESGGEYLADRKISDLSQDASDLIRKHPVESVFLGALAGLLIGATLAKVSGGRRG